MENILQYLEMLWYFGGGLIVGLCFFLLSWEVAITTICVWVLAWGIVITKWYVTTDERWNYHKRMNT